MKNVTKISIAVIGVALLGVSTFAFHKSKTPTIDSLRVQAQEARQGEIRAREAREAREDNLSQAIYDQCYSESLTMTGINFDKKQRKAYDCWRENINNSGTVTSANSEVPPKGITPIIASSVTSESTKKVHSHTKLVPSVKKIEPPKSSEYKCPQKTILRNGWNDPRVQYAYNISCGDMDFIKTIEAESKWDTKALGDSGKSFGLCQIHKGYNAKMQKAYRALQTDNEKVAFCYSQYKDWVKRGVIKTRLYGYNVRNLPQNKNSFTFK